MIIVAGLGDGVGVAPGLTVRRKFLLTSCGPSLTVTVIVEVPVWLGYGETETVRFTPLPPNTMLPADTNEVFDDAPLSCRFTAGVSKSPMVKLTGPAVPLWVID